MKKFDNNLTTIGKKWYEEYQKTEEPCKHSLSKLDVLHLKEEGKKYLDAETTAFQVKQSKSKDSNVRWLKTAVKQGTTSDKIAATIVLMQDHPKYNLSRLTTLVSQVRSAKHNQCSMIMASLKELFITDLLHPKFKLLKLEEQDLDKLNLENESNAIVKTSAAKNRLLAHWYYEDQLRDQYEHFILNLSTVASDTIDTNREKAIATMTDLLIGNSEQEHKLLELIVNKIGDPTSKVASKAVFCINKLLHEHPNMKLVVLREVEKLLFRKNVAQRTQYYAICLLAQFVLDSKSDKIADTLIEVYFAFFKACLKKGEPDSRMMAAILTGVNRAYPFASIDSTVMNEHIDSVYKVVHFGSFNVSLSALNLLHQITGKDETQASRFYSVFYKKLLDPQIGTANKRTMFLNLMYRVLQRDQSELRLYSFMKRILQVSVYFPANMACATLYIVSKIVQSRKHLRHMLIEPHEVIKIEKKEICEVNDELSDTENVQVIDEIQVKDEKDDIIMLSNVTIGTDTALEIKPEVKPEVEVTKSYDPFCRNPLYAGASKGFNMELVTLSRHFHPSVALFANAIIQGKPINYTGDPLEDLTLIRFLDRYVFKNPKKLDDKKVHKKNDLMAQRAGYTPKGLRSLRIDSAAYLNEAEERIPVDELFLYRFLKQKNERRIKKKEDNDDDLESVNSEEFNDMLDNLKGDQDFDDLDIAADIVPKKKKGKANEESEDDVSDEDDNQSKDIVDNDDNVSEDNLNEDNITDDELQDLSDVDFLDVDDDDFSDMEFNDDRDMEFSDEDGDNAELVSDLKQELQKQQQDSNKSKEKKKQRGIDSDIFMSAEKFAEMLEEQSRMKGKHGGSNTFSNRDGANAKQIEWEIKRNQRLMESFGKNKRKRAAKQTSSNNKQMKRFKR
ncbi:CCAAT/enhancer-binding protein zeta [Harpegnathos saltator]|uniref:CCAAT/enhancer-binding protein zeta n=2 Tax=Harpegnathos saltator TaxID=610380 RepID=E2BYS2_HARSA|nr:CCAAT/enhancer-binding protein zeta [Harpegnathos saltator]